MAAISSFLFGVMSGWLYLGSYKSSLHEVINGHQKKRPFKFFLLTMLRIWIFLPFFLLLALLFKLQTAVMLCGAVIAVIYTLFTEMR